MGLCIKCRRNVCTPCVPVQGEAANDNVGIIRLRPAHELLTVERYNAMAVQSSQLNVSSRKFPDFVADTIFEFEGTILNRRRQPWLPDDVAIDNAFRARKHWVKSADEDPLNRNYDFRWIRSFFARAKTPLKQTPQTAMLPRLELIDLALRIHELD